MSDVSAVRTYRYLRIGIVALVVLLGASVLREMIWGVGWLGSISEYYYSPVRNVFVGVLFATGLSLVVIKGHGVEDALLNGAGILAPIIAVVPMQLESGDGTYAFPAGTSEAVANNVVSLAVVALVGLAFAAWTLTRVRSADRAAAERGLAGAVVLIAAFLLWFLVDSGSFERAAHFVAAIGLFGIFVVVAWINSDQTLMSRGAIVYRAISIGMAVIALIAVVFGVLELTDHRPFDHWLFVVEMLLLGLFSAFWLLQTFEYWDEGGA